MKQKFLSISAMQTRYSCSRSTIWRWIQTGKLPEANYINGIRYWLVTDLDKADENIFDKEKPTMKKVNI